MALFLLHKSGNPIIGRDELEKIWDKIDGSEAGQLSKVDVGKVLQLLGALPNVHDLPAESDAQTGKHKSKRDKATELNTQRSKETMHCFFVFCCVAFINCSRLMGDTCASFRPKVGSYDR